MKRILACLILLLFLGGNIPTEGAIEFSHTISSESSTKATGVDVTVSDISFSYTTSGDEEQYRMFSSNYPIIGFNRPQTLYVVDAIVDVPILLEALVENKGTANSGTIDVNIKVLHNEYAQFETVNYTLQLSSLSGGNSNSISKTFTPTYSGNHTLIVRATSTVTDDEPMNDAYVSTLTVARSYFNCDALTGWTVGAEWGISTDTGLSMGSSCHVGNGQASSYSNNLATSLTTPVMDMSDAVSSPTRTNGLSFFYTGSAATNDRLKVQVKTAFGGWFDLTTVQGTVDQSFVDGQDYRTFTVNDGGITSPLIPVPQEHYHSQTQFRFLFESDASVSDIGYYLDEFVIVYDQKVRPEEYSLASNGISTVGSTPGQWGAVRVEVTNDGNISDSVLPQIIGLPMDWEVYYANTNGVSINEESGVLLSPGQSKLIDIKIKPDVNATTGFTQMTFRGVSSQYSSVNTTLPLQFQVMPDREPYIVQPEFAPSCPPGSSCPFSVEVQNIGDATDVFELEIGDTNLGAGWSVNFGWTQSEDVLVRPDTPVQVEFLLTVPQNAIPDSMFEFTLMATSQNSSMRTHTQSIDVSASMVSDAEVGMTYEQLNRDWEVDAGGTVTLEYTIWNNASRQDIFSIDLLYVDQGNWIIEAPPVQAAVVNGGSLTTFRIDITSPTTAQAGDSAPSITPSITSQRSGMYFEGSEFNGISVRTVSDLSLSIVEAPMKLKPGVPVKMTLNVENNGNGPVNAVISTNSIPNTWTWWMRIGDMNHTGPIALSAPYDLEDKVNVDIMIYLPSEERAGEIHTISFRVDSSDGLIDSMGEDNSIEFDAITASVRIPAIVSNLMETTASVGGTASVNISVMNIGNAVDDSFKIMASVSSSPPNNELLSFLSIGESGASRPLNELSTITMMPGQEMKITVDLLIPDSMKLNSRIVVSFDVIAGDTGDGSPFELVHEVLILVDSQRDMDVELSQQSNDTKMSGIPVSFWVNLSSASSRTESFHLDISKPEGWQIVCLGLLMNETGRTFVFEPGHMTLQTTDVRCELHRLNGPTEGTLALSVASDDGVLLWNDEQSFVFQIAQADQFEIDAEVLATSIAGILFIAILLTLLLRKRTHNNASDESELNVKELPEMLYDDVSRGPPISTTTQVATPTSNTNTGPELPPEGLPPNWTMEQWQYYGQQYLDAKQ